MVSCSNDGTVKAWNPHDPSAAMDPVVLGRHADYARCLTTSAQQNWVASGGFDRAIKLWDLSGKKQDPIRILSPPEAANSKASVYSIATDGSGSFIAGGSPEKVIRLWDTRSASRIGKLVGHTDNIRSILVSEDGRYVRESVLSVVVVSLLVVTVCLCRRLDQTLVVGIRQSMHSHILSSYRLCMVTLLQPSRAFCILLW